ncbi:hypothetical protein IEQ34_002274 [Dendrobium chrysotoxum]|uniref:Secreted protein n=1 Tax=Dendrobium chrysotoxum TaxID=161865 RepID=A0AAV7HKV0_DENCH|nr:hypothetical protein IEQ34_002274 [Dendrobium chrysotoxum]
MASLLLCLPLASEVCAQLMDLVSVRAFFSEFDHRLAAVVAHLQLWHDLAQNNVIFMYSRSTVASAVSCASGKKKSSGVLIVLLPGFLGYSVDFVNFHLLKAIVRSTYSSAVLGIR